MPSWKTIWENSFTFADWVNQAQRNQELWSGVYREATIPEWAMAEARKLPTLKLLALAEDWCGDAANTVPVLAKLTALTPQLELGIIERDANPEIMDRYLTNGSRSIPIVIGFDEGFTALGYWGPRPAELQAWTMQHQSTMPSEKRYKYMRGWYSRDRGESTLREVLDLVNSSTPYPPSTGGRRAPSLP